MTSLTLAVGTSDGVSVCDHLARSTAFIVLEVRDSAVAARSLRERNSDACGNHRTFVEMLEGCQAVICGGIGEGAARALQAHGITPVVLAEKQPVDDAVNQYLAGTLPTTEARVCLCSGHDD